MPNPTFASGNLTRTAGDLVEKFHLVELSDGDVVHNGGGFPFGAVTESAASEQEREDNYLAHGLPSLVRVHTAQCVVPLVTEDDDFEVGGTVYAAADGAVSSSGSVAVGVVDREAEDGLVRTVLFHPSILAGGGTDPEGP